MELKTSKNLFGLNHLVFGESSLDLEIYCVPGICLNHEMFTKTYDPLGISFVDFFVSKGFKVHVLDWQDFIPPLGEHFGEFISRTISDIVTDQGGEAILITHSTSGAYGWKVAEINPWVKKIIALAPAAPGNIQKSFITNEKDVVFKSGEYTYHIDSKSGFTPDELWVQEKLVAHAPCFPQERISNLYSTCKTCDPRAILERFNTNGIQLKLDEEVIQQRKDLEIFVVTGDFDPPHPYNVDNEIVNYFKNLGIMSEFVWLPDIGLKGHGHMFTMENGCVEIFNKIFEKTGLKTAEDMGVNTGKAFSGDGLSLAIIKTYADSVDIFVKALKTKLNYSGVVTSYGSLADFGTFSGEFLKNLVNRLSLENISFSKIYGLEINSDALEKNIVAEEKIVTDLVNIPVKDKTFDISTARYVLQWNSLDRQEKIIKEIIRTTKMFSVIQHPSVDYAGQEKFHEIFKGELIPSLKRIESYYSTQEEIEQIFERNNIKFEVFNKEKIQNISDVFIERYGLSETEASSLKRFLGSDDYWDRVTWVIY